MTTTEISKSVGPYQCRAKQIVIGDTILRNNAPWRVKSIRVSETDSILYNIMNDKWEAISGYWDPEAIIDVVPRWPLHLVFKAAPHAPLPEIHQTLQELVGEGQFSCGGMKFWAEVTEGEYIKLINTDWFEEVAIDEFLQYRASK